jgi:hypothetical protein
MPFKILALLAFCLFPFVAMAKDDQAFCDGKYARAQEMLDAAYGKYGTIYTGGFDGSSYGGNGVGPTIDLWRLWRGLPDLRFRDANRFDYSSDWGWDFSDFGRNPGDLEIVLRIAERRQATGLSPVYRYITARYLNTLVSAGSGPGWWLAPNASDTTLLQDHVIKAAKPGSLMEWLLVMQADSDSPDATAWVRKGDWAQTARYIDGQPHPRTMLRELVSGHARKLGGLEWKAAAFVTDGASGAGQNHYSNKLNDCETTPAEYAVGTIELYERYRRDHRWGEEPDLSRLRQLPEAMRRSVLANFAMIAVARLGRTDRPSEWLQDVLETIASQSPEPRFSTWLFVGRIWTAGRIEDLIRFHDGSALDTSAAHSLNMLSLNDLIAFEELTRLPQDQHRMLVTIILGRAFVFGRLETAEKYLKKVRTMLPDHAAAIGHALNGQGADDVRIARAILALPNPSVRLQPYDDAQVAYIGPSKSVYYFTDIDLPVRILSGAVINKDLRQWFRAPFYPNRYQFVERSKRRGRIYQDDDAQPFIPDEWDRGSGYPFLRLIAWDELGQLGVCHGLTKRLSEVVIDWADQSSDSWWDSLFVDKELVADSLRRIIVLNKRSPGALVNGGPAGQVAKRLLETRFAETQAAKATPYWYFEDQGCRN